MFDTTTPQDAAALVKPPPELDTLRRFVGAATPDDPDAEPDQWDDGRGMKAPMPSTFDPNGAAYRTALEASFVTEDCTSDVWERKIAGLLGNDPHWSIEPDADLPDDKALDALNAEDDPAAAGAALVASGAVTVEDGKLVPSETTAAARTEAEVVDGLMRTWWARQAGGAGAETVLKAWLGGMALCGRSYLRVFVPAGRLVEKYREARREDGSVTEAYMALDVATPEEALRHIYVEHVWPDQAVLHTDRDKMADLGVVTFADADAKGDAALVEGTALQMVYLESDREDAATVIRSVRGQTDETQALDLGGRLTLFEGRMRPTVTPSVLANQRDLNTKRTMAAINDSKAGFPEIIFTDVEQPTRQVRGQDGNPEEVPAEYVSGAGNVGFMVSIPKTDENGQPTGSSGSGSVTRFGPVDNVTLHEGAKVAREAIFRGAKQFHVLALSGANLSGEAMIQGQGEFLNDLMDGKGTVDAGGRWMLETPWHMACALVGLPERAGQVRAVFDCRPSAGPLSAAMRTAILAENEAGLMSDERAMSLLGVDDIDAERKRLADEAETAARIRGAEALSLFSVPANETGGNA